MEKLGSAPRGSMTILDFGVRQLVSQFSVSRQLVIVTRDLRHLAACRSDPQPERLRSGNSNLAVTSHMNAFWARFGHLSTTVDQWWPRLLIKFEALTTAGVLHHPFKNRRPALAWTGDNHPHGKFKRSKEGKGSQYNVNLLVFPLYRYRPCYSMPINVGNSQSLYWRRACAPTAAAVREKREARWITLYLPGLFPSLYAFPLRCCEPFCSS